MRRDWCRYRDHNSLPDQCACSADVMFLIFMRVLDTGINNAEGKLPNKIAFSKLKMLTSNWKLLPENVHIVNHTLLIYTSALVPPFDVIPGIFVLRKYCVLVHYWSLRSGPTVQVCAAAAVVIPTPQARELLISSVSAGVYWLDLLLWMLANRLPTD